MKMNKLLGAIFAIFVGVVLFAPAHSLAAAFGVSPPWIENSNMKPGDSFVYMIDLSANDLPEEMIINSKLEGDPEIAHWLSVQSGDSLIMNKGKSVVPLAVNVNIPEDARAGKYEGNLKISLSPVNGSKNDISILLGGNVSVQLGIVDYDVTSYEVRSAEAAAIAEGKPIDVQLSIKNLGNTTISNMMTKLTVLERRTAEQVMAVSEDVKLHSPVYPHTLTNTKLSVLAPDLEAGEYWVDLEFLEGSSSIYRNRLFLAVDPNKVNNALTTAVEVMQDGQIRPAAASDTGIFSGNTKVQTSVKVRAPLTNQLIVVMIGLLLIVTGILGKFYLTFKKRRR